MCRGWSGGSREAHLEQQGRILTFADKRLASVAQEGRLSAFAAGGLLPFNPGLDRRIGSQNTSARDDRCLGEL